jgi:LemA protein
MNKTLLIILGVIVLAVLAGFGMYNSLVNKDVAVTSGWAQVENVLQRRADLIPNLVSSVKGYMKHEKGIFLMLTDARKLVESAIKSNDPKTIDKAQAAIGGALRSIRLMAESNPQIQAASLVTDLMNELRDTADKVMYARRTLIDLSADFNVKISTIPGIWIAPLMGFQTQKGLDTPVSGEFLEVTQTETATPKVDLN